MKKKEKDLTINEKKIKELYGSDVVVSNSKAIPPYTPIENGYGYYGVLLENEIDESIMCHICGKWLKGITGRHIQSHYRRAETEVSNTSEYKQKYGFLRKTALLLRESRKKISKSSSRLEHIEKLKRGLKRFHNKKHYEKMRIGASKPKSYQRSAEMRNKWGSCDAQLLYKLNQFVEKKGQVPGVKDVSWGCTAERRFGSWARFLSLLNLKPSQYRYNDKELLVFLKRFIEREERNPHWSDFCNGSLPTRSVYSYHFGTWQKALNLIK